MPIRCAFHPEEGLIIAEADGQITSADIIGYYQRMVQDPEYSRDFDELALAPEAEFMMKEQDTHVVGRWFKESRPVRRIALVMEKGFGIGRMVQNRVGDENAFRVFRTEAEARVWLSLPFED